ncbi:efflux RND transporter periplasmic adaptor subunit [Desulfosporosinus sp. BG]|uniref:efflux RND transporter periplasmic adaptor subunit n=1 Tax=Desulfosporosinus sp. BG TaxID=1633135 RepID=UPI00083ABC19|nr:efflux RND transporter periplasmic adaptor subunit [Desulfosporosinus sp. BG]ODA42916.1 secretion protein HlyD family protein [Desulfosporosinus sp. BG]
MTEQVASEQLASNLIPSRGPRQSASFKKILLVAGAILLVSVLVGLNIYRINNKDVEQVSVSRVNEKHLVEKVPASGNVVTNDRETVFSEVSGTVKNIRVQMGEKVTDGQVLMDLYIPNADQRLAEAKSQLASAESELYQARSGGLTAEEVSAQAAFAQAESTYKQDKDDLEREQALFKDGAVAQTELEKAQVDFDSSEAAYNKAQADLQRVQDGAPVYLQSLQASVDSARLQLELVKKQTAQQGLLSPRGGQVLSISVNQGDQISVNTPLLTIGNLASLSIRTDVPESEAGKIKVGQAAEISGNAFQGDKYQGKVTQVGLEVVTKTKKNQDVDTFLPVIVSVEGATRLLPGYNVDLEITTADSQALVVPIEALVVRDDEEDSVFIIKDGVARLTKVKTGISDGITMEIKEGVAKDDQVVTNPGKLQDGGKVRIK